MKREIGQYENMEIEYGDFCERCFPKTYKYFKEMKLDDEYRKSRIDGFDCFIKDKVKFFAFLIDQYYKSKKNIALQLKNMTDEKILNHMDILIHEYLSANSRTAYFEAKELYIYLLESYVNKLVTRKAET